jgi:outer membrane protein assembly factor BamB
MSNVRRAGSEFLCAGGSAVSPTPTASSSLFVNIDGFAYVAFSESEATMTAPPCAAGSTVSPRDIGITREETVVLWRIRPDGSYRSTIVEETRGRSPLPEAFHATYPTGSMIPDGLGGVLLSVRRSAGPAESDDFVYRVDENGTLVYRFPLPKHQGGRNDEMVLGDHNVLAFATRGGWLIAFDVREGKEKWRWSTKETIEVLAALANGGCLVQTPAALLEVDNATTSKKVFDGKAMMDWQGHIYRKHS